MVIRYPRYSTAKTLISKTGQLPSYDVSGIKAQVDQFSNLSAFINKNLKPVSDFAQKEAIDEAIEKGAEYALANPIDVDDFLKLDTKEKKKLVGDDKFLPSAKSKAISTTYYNSVTNTLWAKATVRIHDFTAEAETTNMSAADYWRGLNGIANEYAKGLSDVDPNSAIALLNQLTKGNASKYAAYLSQKDGVNDKIVKANVMVAVELGFESIFANIRSFSTRYNPNTGDKNYFVAEDLWEEFQQFKLETSEKLASAGISPGITKAYLGEMNTKFEQAIINNFTRFVNEDPDNLEQIAKRRKMVKEGKFPQHEYQNAIWNAKWMRDDLKIKIGDAIDTRIDDRNAQATLDKKLDVQSNKETNENLKLDFFNKIAKGEEVKVSDIRGAGWRTHPDRDKIIQSTIDHLGGRATGEVVLNDDQLLVQSNVQVAAIEGLIITTHDIVPKSITGLDKDYTLGELRQNNFLSNKALDEITDIITKRNKPIYQEAKNELKSFFDMYEEKITSMDKSMLGKATLLRVGKWKRTMNTRMLERIADGIPLNKIFDPSSEHYIGIDIDNFIPERNTLLEEMTKNFDIFNTRKKYNKGNKPKLEDVKKTYNYPSSGAKETLSEEQKKWLEEKDVESFVQFYLRLPEIKQWSELNNATELLKLIEIHKK